MNTKPIPIIVTLAAAGISCVISVLQHVDFAIYTKRLLAAVVIFSIIGVIAKKVLDKAFPVMDEENTEENVEVDADIEDVEAADEDAEEPEENEES